TGVGIINGDSKHALCNGADSEIRPEQKRSRLDRGHRAPQQSKTERRQFPTGMSIQEMEMKGVLHVISKRGDHGNPSPQRNSPITGLQPKFRKMMRRKP